MSAHEAALESLATAKAAVQEMRLDVAIRRDSLLTESEMIAALDASPSAEQADTK